MVSPSRFHIPFSWFQRTQKVQYAVDHGHGVEIAVFSSGEAVDVPYARGEQERRIAKMLGRFSGAVSMHGAFQDLAVHSADSHIAHHSRQRIREDLRLAARLGCRKVVFHTGFNPLIPSVKYRERFLAAQGEFWQNAAGISPGVTLCVENQWELEPGLLAGLMTRIDRPNVRLCLDVGHAHAYSPVPPQVWLRQLAPWVVHMHWSDNLGDTDSHLPIGEGSIHWVAIMEETRRLADTVSIVIELNSLTAIQQSLAFLDDLRLEEALRRCAAPFCTDLSLPLGAHPTPLG